MFVVKIITAGKIKESYLIEAIQEYEKRLKPYTKIDWIVAKTDKELIDLVAKEPSYICLDLTGKLFDSKSFSKALFKSFEKENSRLTFIIGGFEGIPRDLVKKSLFSICLSPLTFTSQMTRLIFIEQLYRAFQIHLNTKYHR